MNLQQMLDEAVKDTDASLEEIQHLQEGIDILSLIRDI